MRKEFIDRVKGEEGFSPVAYWDNKQWTYGYGTRAPSDSATITEDQAQIELIKELLVAEADFRAVFPTDPPGLNQVRYEAIVDMLFNIGRTSFSNFIYTIAAIKSGMWDKAAAHASASLWYRQVGNRSKRIVVELKTGWPNGREPGVLEKTDTHNKAEEEKEGGQKWYELLGLWLRRLFLVR